MGDSSSNTFSTRSSSCRTTSTLRDNLSFFLSDWCIMCLNYYAPACREGGSKRCFCPSVRLSVCSSVAYIANKRSK